MEEIIKIIILSLSSITVLFIITKILGNRELAQLTMFDYINSITIGSIAAEMSTSLEDNFLQPLVAMLIYAAVIFLISYCTNKSITIRRFVEGHALILYDNGYIYNENLKKTRLDVNEFLMECRINGYFNISDIQTAIYEANGKISFLPKSTKRPANPEDLSIVPTQDRVVTNLIIDGKILQDNLKSAGKNEEWLNKNLKEQNYKKVEDVFLATYDFNENLSVFPKNDKKISHDPFK